MLRFVTSKKIVQLTATKTSPQRLYHEFLICISHDHHDAWLICIFHDSGWWHSIENLSLRLRKLLIVIENRSWFTLIEFVFLGFLRILSDFKSKRPDSRPHVLHTASWVYFPNTTIVFVWIFFLTLCTRLIFFMIGFVIKPTGQNIRT